MSAAEKMKSRKKRKSPSNNDKHLPQISEFKYIPPEVWIQIFATLPVKTLVRFRCVCKSWCSIIDDPNFIYMHLKLCSKKSQKNKLLLLLSVEGLGRYRGKGTLLTVRQADTLTKTAQIFKSCDAYDVLRRCDGLFLMRRYVFPMCHKELRLCNLSIRKSLLIPPCPLPHTSHDEAVFVFGFAPYSKDYKIIAITFDESVDGEPTEMYVAVHTLSDQQWTVRNNGLNIGCRNFVRIFESCDFESAEFFFQGAGHWLGNDPYVASNHGDKPTHLVSLDLDTEKFSFWELPYAYDESKTVRCLFNLRESLAIFSISNVSSSIWVLKQDNGKGVWTLWFEGHSSCDGFNLFYSCGGEQVFYYESDGGSHLICWRKSYNIASCQVKELGKSLSRYIELETFSESLVLCNGYGAEDLMSFP